MTKEKLQTLESALPPIELFSPRCELDYYGFSIYLSKQLKLKKTPFPLISGWKHGWLPSYSLKFSEQLVQEGTKDDFVVVSTILQKDFLISKNFNHVTAGGLPYCYIPSTNTVKIKNSLLIIPVHTLRHVEFNSDLKTFFKNASEIAKNYETVAVLEHLDSDFEIYKKEFPNLYFIKGASALDKNSLQRIKKIFASFESVITNGIGSHVIYANLEQCKTSIIPPFYHHSRESLLKHPWYQKNSHLLEQSEMFNEVNSRVHLPFLFSPIENQRNYIDWAISEAGSENVMNNQQLFDTLAWSGIKMTGRSMIYPKSFIKNCISFKQLRNIGTT